MNYTTLAFENISVLILIIAIGYILRIKNILPKEASKILSTLVYWLFLPAVIFKSITENLSPDNIYAEYKYIVLGLIMVTVSFVISFIIARFFEKKGQFHDIVAYSLAIPNIGYIGYPLIQGVLGDEGLFHMVMFAIFFNVGILTIGDYILNPKRELKIKALINPTLVMMALAVVLALLGIKMPKIVNNTVSNLASCMAPSAMLLAGVLMSEKPLKEMFTSKRIYLLMIIKNFFMPLLFGAILYLIGLRGEIYIIAVASVALPMGLNAAVFPEAHGGDGSEGAKSCFISTLFAVISIPLVFYIITNIA